MKYPTKSEQDLVVVRNVNYKEPREKSWVSAFSPELKVLLFDSVDEFKKFVRYKCGCYNKEKELKDSADLLLQFGIKSRICSKATAYYVARKQIELHTNPSEFITVQIGKLGLAELEFLHFQIKEGHPVNSNLSAIKEMFISRRIGDLQNSEEPHPELGSKTWLEDLAKSWPGLRPSLRGNPGWC